METLPTLYKKTATGKIQQWRIWVDGTTINSESGQTDGKKILSSDVIKRGKNEGRSNATTAAEQAVLEAKAKHTKKLKAGYVTSIEDAESGKTDAVIEGGLVPMTAKSFFEFCKKTAKQIKTRDSKHIEYPCGSQPKLDGIRCCCEPKDAKQNLFTRTRKPILTVPHIEKALTQLPKFPWDGELYNHDYKDNFEVIVSMVKRKELHPDHTEVQYHIYDVILPNKTFAERMKIIKEASKLVGPTSPIKFVATKKANNEQELLQTYEKFLDQGYEGAMARNIKGLYEQKRSKHLQKLKVFVDHEFEVIDVIEGRGKLQGHAGSFICKIPDDFDEHGERTFKAKMEGKLDNLKVLFENPKMWKNQMLNVRYQGISNKDYLPRFPVGVRFRESKAF